MFFITKSILSLPLLFLVWLGTPFRFDVESSLRNFTPELLRASYNSRKTDHYVPRIFVSSCGLLILSVLATLITFNLKLLIVFPILILFLLAIDSVLLLARYMFFRAKKTESDSTELVLSDFWKDSSLKELLKKRDEEEVEFKAERKKRIAENRW